MHVSTPSYSHMAAILQHYAESDLSAMRHIANLVGTERLPFLLATLRRKSSEINFLLTKALNMPATSIFVVFILMLKLICDIKKP